MADELDYQDWLDYQADMAELGQELDGEEAFEPIAHLTEAEAADLYAPDQAEEADLYF